MSKHYSHCVHLDNLQQMNNGLLLVTFSNYTHSKQHTLVCNYHHVFVGTGKLLTFHVIPLLSHSNTSLCAAVGKRNLIKTVPGETVRIVVTLFQFAMVENRSTQMSVVLGI